MATDTDVEMSFADMAKAALSDSQRDILISQPAPLREAVYQRIEASLRLSARLQMAACCMTGINPVIFERVVAEEQRRLDADAARHNLLVKLVQGNASFIVLSTLLGTDKATYTRIRSELGITSQASRKQIDDLTSVRIYRKWEELGCSISVETVLQLHEFSGESISILWSLLQDWQQVRAMVGRRSQCQI